MKHRTLAGTALIFASLGLYAASAFIITEAVDEKNRADARFKENETQCLRHLESIPFARVRNTRSFAVTVAPIGEPREALMTASTAVMMCPTRDLVAMCLGDKCAPERPNIVSLAFELAPSKEK